MGFSENLRVIRKNKGLTQKDLSDKVGVALSTVAMWETGSRRPGYKTAQRVADILDVSIDKLLQDKSFSSEEYLSENELYSRITPKTRNANQDLLEIREVLRSRPEMKMLFSVSKGATKSDIERAVAIIEALKKDKGR